MIYFVCFVLGDVLIVKYSRKMSCASVLNIARKSGNYIEGWERKRSKRFFTYIHLDFFFAPTPQIMFAVLKGSCYVSFPTELQFSLFKFNYKIHSSSPLLLLQFTFKNFIFFLKKGNICRVLGPSPEVCSLKCYKIETQKYPIILKEGNKTLNFCVVIWHGTKKQWTSIAFLSCYKKGSLERSLNHLKEWNLLCFCLKKSSNFVFFSPTRSCLFLAYLCHSRT